MPNQKKFTYTTTATWGPAMKQRLNRRFAPIVEQIRLAMGAGVGSRNTFAKLLEMDSPPAGAKDRYRAWLLLTTAGEDLGEWGISDADVPPGVNVATARKTCVSLGRVERLHWLAA